METEIKKKKNSAKFFLFIFKRMVREQNICFLSERKERFLALVPD